MTWVAAVGLACALVAAGCGASASPTTIPCVTPAPLATAGALLEPGVARLAGARGCVADGVRGSWTLDERSYESTWVSGTTLDEVRLTTSDLVLVGWADGTPIGEWSARIATAADPSGALAREAGSGDAGGADFVTVGRIAAGEWVIELTLERADGRGRATYYWSLSVS